MNQFETSVTSTLFNEVPVASQESERPCIRGLGVSMLPVFTNFGPVPIVRFPVFVFHVIVYALYHVVLVF